MIGVRVDVAVVGLGLVGAAATRHLATAGVELMGIGPGEPADWADHDGPYASHYDSGRITRRLDARKEWAVLASRAIDQYPVIANESGIEFHRPAGLIFVRNDSEGIANQVQVVRDLELPVSIGTVDEAGSVGAYRFPAGWTLLTEPDPAGFIDPRQMARAQIVAAEKSGAEIRSEVATELDPVPGGGWRITTVSGEVDAGSVLLATGPYLQDLHTRELQACVRPEAVIL
ncbi:MAG: NAD(P)/FAD-dependent oxidoreductase, partial [Acidimicrobiales bacterium]